VDHMLWASDGRPPPTDSCAAGAVGGLNGFAVEGVGGPEPGAENLGPVGIPLGPVGGAAGEFAGPVM
jgi:hypothetical protein